MCLASVALKAQTLHDAGNAWGNIESDIAPWTVNISRPNHITRGLEGRHLSVWASHGRYYDQDKEKWKWQRPNLFSTIEDIFTQTIVVPYLIPMLERAGANVFTPRERDWQPREIIVDNDLSTTSGHLLLDNASIRHEIEGFRMHPGNYVDGENPFTAGTALVLKTERHRKPSTLTYLPTFTAPGRYAVYVSYPKMDDAVDDVHYTVCHSGMRTEFVVNQQIGYGTWVYLGTFHFDKTDEQEPSLRNCVLLSTASQHKGSIGADAVRFGGGMGNIERGGQTSGLPRSFEGARYYGQWAGAPYSVYSDKQGENDYGDDINVRSLMTNWLGGGSVYMPTVEGLGVPIELTLAIHSDAGYADDGRSVHGSLAIATTNHNDGVLSSGISRQTSLQFASQLLDNLTTDMTNTFGTWGKRYLWDRNYSETRLPEVPSAIIETLSHQSFPDMVIGQHPLGKFHIARSIYKTILRYVSAQHGKSCVVAPLAPTNFRLSLCADNKVELQWSGVNDPHEPSATPTSYNIYTSVGTSDFDNGQNIASNICRMQLQPDTQYNFKVTACNDGGESFATEVLSAYIASEAEGTVLVVNGFERLSAPQIIDTDTEQGFDLSVDAGVQRGLYAGWSGQQQAFDKARMGQVDSLGLGFSTNELDGTYIMGNTFDYVADHTRAIASARRYSVVSSSFSAVNANLVNFSDYSLVDLAFGLQKDDGQLGVHHTVFSSLLKEKLINYAVQGGAIMASGSYLGSEMQSVENKEFMNTLLKLCFHPMKAPFSGGEITGLGMQYHMFCKPNAEHYAAEHPEVLSPQGGAICAMQYSDGSSAAVAYKGTYSCFTMGFPFECIIKTEHKDKIMQGILKYLLN